MRCVKTQKPQLRVLFFLSARGYISNMMTEVPNIQLLYSRYGREREQLSKLPATQPTPKVACGTPLLHSEMWHMSVCFALSLSQFEQFPFHYALTVSVLSPFWLIQVFKFQISSLSLSFIWDWGNILQPLDMFTILKIITKKTKNDKIEQHTKGCV